MMARHSSTQKLTVLLPFLLPIFIAADILKDKDGNYQTNATPTEGSSSSYGPYTSSSPEVNSSTKSAMPLADLQIVDAQGVNVDRVSAGQKIRLKVQSLATPAFQSPFVKSCWYKQNADNTMSQAGDDKSIQFVDRGCKVPLSDLNLDSLAFSENGILDKQSRLFDLMPFFEGESTFLTFRCEVYLCHADAVCSVMCPAKRTNMWKMEQDAKQVFVTNTIVVERTRHTEPKAQNVDDFRKDGIIKGGKGYFDMAPQPPKDDPFLKKHQHYFVVSTLGVIVLLVISVIAWVFFNMSRRSRNDYLKSKFAAGSGGSYLNNMSGSPGFGGNAFGGVNTSPPPAYIHSSAYKTPLSKLTTPANLLEPRQFTKLSTTPVPRQHPLHRRLDWEAIRRDEENSNLRPQLDWNKFSDSEITSSPVGGEFYRGPSDRVRSSSQSRDELIEHTPFRGRGRTSLGVALKEYFDRYGM